MRTGQTSLPCVLATQIILKTDRVSGKDIMYQRKSFELHNSRIKVAKKKFYHTYINL